MAGIDVVSTIAVGHEVTQIHSSAQGEARAGRTIDIIARSRLASGPGLLVVGNLRRATIGGRATSSGTQLQTRRTALPVDSGFDYRLIRNGIVPTGATLGHVPIVERSE